MPVTRMAHAVRMVTITPRLRRPTVLDPVCGMTVDPATAKNRLIYQGHEYFFCGARCRERFNADPESFLKPKEPAPPAPAGTIYTCPMHPEIRQEGPGQLSDLRHGAGAGAGLARRQARS